MSTDRQDPNPVADLASVVANDPVVHDMTVGFIRTLFAGVTKDFLDGDRKTRMDIAKVFLTPMLRDGFARRGSKTEAEAQLSARAAEIRNLIGGILPDDE